MKPFPLTLAFYSGILLCWHKKLYAVDLEVFVMQRKKEVWCTNVEGASLILNRTRATVHNYLRKELISGFRYGNSRLIPMGEIARLLNVTESRAVNIAKQWDLPLWRCKR